MTNATGSGKRGEGRMDCPETKGPYRMDEDLWVLRQRDCLG